MSNRTAYFREYKRKQRLKLRKQGICAMCSTRKVRPGYTTCQVCIAKALERDRRNLVESKA